MKGMDGLAVSCLGCERRLKRRAERRRWHLVLALKQVGCARQACWARASGSLAARAGAEQLPQVEIGDPSSDLARGSELATFISAETEFAMERGSGRMADCLLPRDSAEALIDFFRWAAARRGGAISDLISLQRAASVLMTRTRDEDLTVRADVQLALAELHSADPL